MINPEEFLLSFNGESDIKSVRKNIRSLSITYGFKGKEITKILKSMREILRNVVLHGGNKADIRINKLRDKNSKNIGMEIIVEDYGPGFQRNDLGLTKTGFGLSLVNDLTDEFIISSKSNNYLLTTGCICKLRFYRERNVFGIKSRNDSDLEAEITRLNFELHAPFQWTVFGDSFPRVGEIRNGDKVLFFETDDFILGSVIDGIGHGYTGDIASSKAKKLIENHMLEPLDYIISNLHRNLKETVGAQCFIIRIDKNLQIGEYIGVGNIRAYIVQNGSKIEDLITKDGTLGLILPHYQVEKVALNEPKTIVIHSDGVSKKWIQELRILRIKKFNQVIIVKDLLEKYRKDDDDATVLVIQNN